MQKTRIGTGEEGMLWLSLDTKSPLSKRIGEAVDYFKNKYNEIPAIVYINPKTLGDNNVKVKGIKIIPEPITLENHFYIYCKKRK